MSTHYDRLYQRKGISKKVRDVGNAELAKKKAEQIIDRMKSAKKYNFSPEKEQP